MKLHLLMKVFICIGFLTNSQFLDSQESDKATKGIEKKWGLEDDDKFPESKKESLLENTVPLFLTQFQPPKQEFPINPTMENVIKGKYGTKITIPANSISLPMGYRRGDILNIELIEIYNDLDFITSGISLIYHDSKPSIFESGGMFKIIATYYDKPLNLKKGIKIRVEIPNLFRNVKKMKMYKLDDRVGWIDKGEFSKTESKSNQNEPNAQNEDNVKNIESLSYLVFNYLDDFKWWNCDYPNPNTTCVEGDVNPIEANPPYSITSVGIDYKNATTRYAEKNKFQINAIKGKKIKLIAMDSKGNIGLSKELDTGSLDAYLNTKTKTKCTDVGTIQIQKIPRDILKDRNKMIQYLGLQDIVK